ncbi:hypothetical protein MTR67_025542 [Solanum verrucosum]|uniref:Uncharacterized protein n=1 Tax=Solanum verrucosum TaxID=315347 RepID=A0AAF0QXC7_SOLVR|nr:hypothetical protein MTR67_025542 [Solanum verrucosum]
MHRGCVSCMNTTTPLMTWSW